MTFPGRFFQTRSPSPQSRVARKFSLVTAMMSLARSNPNHACPVCGSKMADTPADDEESEVFEITDFTTASEWERFIARLEEIIHEWKLDGGNRNLLTHSKSSISSFSTEPTKVNPIPEKQVHDEREGTWAFIQDTINFANFSFNISYHYLKRRNKRISRTILTQEGGDEGLPTAVVDMFDMDFDFPPRVHCLSRWYGLKEFMVLTPAQNTEAIDNESRCHLLLSSIAIAFNNSKCSIPMFIQAHQRWRRLYYGLCLGGEFRTLFEMCHLKHTPAHNAHLAGLLEVFKDKLACPLSPRPPITVSIRFTYILDEWTDYAWPQKAPPTPSCTECHLGHRDFGVIPFGACDDPISELHLSTTWPCLSEDVVVDNEVYSDLDPLQSPEWSVRVRTSENARCLLGEHFGNYMMLCYRQESTVQLLRPEADASQVDITQALQKLTDPGHGLPVSSLSSAVTKASSRISSIGDLTPQEYPIPKSLLNELLKHLFPDADEDAVSLEARQDEYYQTSKESQPEKDRDTAQQDKFRGLKSAPEDSLTFSLAVCLCIVYNSHGGLRAVAHLWHEFVLEMRYRWENDVFIPRLSLDSPNLGSCLIQQKLQMLNCCIERRRASRPLETETSSSARATNSTSNLLTSDDSAPQDAVSRSSSSTDGDDEEFFEAVEELGAPSNTDVRESCGETSDIEASGSPSNTDVRESCGEPSDIEASGPSSECLVREGALGPYKDLCLLESPDEPLCIPITQEPAPMTEDMLQEHAEVLTQLGTTEEGARVRAQMQSASLLSDMEAFKAANPGCLLEDFVRWYSPNDWLSGPETPEEAEEVRRHEELYAAAHNSGDAAQDTEGTSATGGGGITERGEAVNESKDGWVDGDGLDEDEMVERSAALELMNEAKAGHVPELHFKPKWSDEGHLSLRMRTPGNMWAEVWHSAKPVPVRRQKRLFDETKEAEKVLHFLAALKPSEVAFHLFPVLLHAMLLRVEQSGGRDIPAVALLLDNVINKARKLHWIMPDDLPHCEEIVKELQLAELVIARASSLQFKFRDALAAQKKTTQEVDGERNLDEFLAALREKPEVTVIGAGRGPAGRVIHRLFAKQESARLEQCLSDPLTNQQSPPSPSTTVPQDFPAPTGREYILRTAVPRPARSSRVSPQRMYCVLTADEFRLAGAFTEDVTFQ